jgi:hypothetical protein
MTELERGLVAVAEVIDWPVADLRAGVRARLLERPRPRAIRPWVRVAVVMALVILVVAAGTPWGREAVADLFGAGGIVIRTTDTKELVGADLQLGERIPLSDAAAAVEFPIWRPARRPDAVFHDDLPVGGSIHMAWASDPTLPAAGDTGIGTLYSQFRVIESEVFLKSVDPSARIEEVTVRGERGFWIEGAAHYLLYRDAEGDIKEDFGRLAGNVLVWEENGVTHRVETSGSREETLRFADSLRPAGD